MVTLIANSVMVTGLACSAGLFAYGLGLMTAVIR